MHVQKVKLLTIIKRMKYLDKNRSINFYRLACREKKSFGIETFRNKNLLA